MSDSLEGFPEPGRYRYVGAADILAFLARYAWYLVGGAVLGALLGTLIAEVLPHQWESSIVLQIGRISQGQAQTQRELGPYSNIELPAVAAARITLPEFQAIALRRLNLPEQMGKDRNTDLFRRTISAKPVRDTDLLEISVRGYSAEDAQRFIDAIQKELIAIHATIAKPSLDRLKSQSEYTTRMLALAMEQGQRLSALASGRDAKRSGDFAESVLLNQMMADNGKQIQALQEQQIQLQEQSSPSRSYNTRAISASNVSSNAVFPRLAIFAPIGLVFGLGIAFLIALWVAYRRGEAQG